MIYMQLMILFSCSLTFLFILYSTAEKGFLFLQQKIVKKRFIQTTREEGL